MGPFSWFGVGPYWKYKNIWAHKESVKSPSCLIATFDLSDTDKDVIYYHDVITNIIRQDEEIIAKEVATQNAMEQLIESKERYYHEFHETAEYKRMSIINSSRNMWMEAFDSSEEFCTSRLLAISMIEDALQLCDLLNNNRRNYGLLAYKPKDGQKA